MTDKGLVLTRRDNSNFIRILYQTIISKIFEGENEEDVIYFIVQNIISLFSFNIKKEDFVITKQLGDIENTSKIEIEGNEKKLKFSNYIVTKPLPL